MARAGGIEPIAFALTGHPQPEPNSASTARQKPIVAPNFAPPARPKAIARRCAAEVQCIKNSGREKSVYDDYDDDDDDEEDDDDDDSDGDDEVLT